VTITFMPRVLIAGCGYAGEAVADLLAGKGWDVQGWTASAESAERLAGKAYPVRAVDIGDDEQVRAQALDFDQVIHCASTRGGDVDLYRRVYRQGARNLLERFALDHPICKQHQRVCADKWGMGDGGERGGTAA